MSGSGDAPGGGDDRGEKARREEEISRRAYEKWEREGRPHGRDKDHWWEAERELAGGDGARRQTPPGLEAGAPAAATATGGTTATAKATARKTPRPAGSAAGSGAARGQKPS